MSDETAFLSAIRAAPGEDTPRLVFADWLQERDDPRAEYLRLDVEITRHAREGRVAPAAPATRRLELEGLLDRDWVWAVMHPMLRELPRPLGDLVKRDHPRSGYGPDRFVITRDWVCEVGDEQAKAALSQVALVLALPPGLMGRYEIGWDFEEAYGFVGYYGDWQSALAQVIGVPQPSVPDRQEWLARWKDT